MKNTNDNNEIHKYYVKYEHDDFQKIIDNSNVVLKLVFTKINNSKTKFI